jgi:large subunit ribosomal protein L6
MRPVVIPQGVKVTIEPTVFHVEGPKGRLSQEYRPDVTIAVRDGAAVVERKSDSKQARAYHGLYRSLLNNMVTGVSQGFKRALIVSGVGYRAEVQGNLLVLSIGYSSDVVAVIPEGLKVSVEQNGQRIVIEGIDRAKVGKFASEVRSLRGPEPYKGKGIRYEEERIRRKVGKTGVK